MNVDEIKQLVKIVEESQIADLEVTRWGSKVKISKYSSKSHLDNRFIHAYAPESPQRNIFVAATDISSGQQAAERPGESATTKGLAHSATHNAVEVKSPMVGTFYSAPAPDAETYVNVGSVVSKGQVLCIIEAMKLMNEIEAEFPCRVLEILVDNAQPVEYNQPLFRVEKI